MRKFVVIPIGLLILAIGVAIAVGVFTQTTNAETGATTPGIIPIALPTALFGFPMIAIAGVIALIGIAVVIVGWKFGF